uniref:Uncharacterized protein n=1 Tax=Arundo donax TaxID=35708 RepID=A0A0A8Y9N8_ARUDO
MTRRVASIEASNHDGGKKKRGKKLQRVPLLG